MAESDRANYCVLWGVLMTKYFEAINDSNQSIVIDDTFKNIEVLDSFPLSECNFTTWHDSNHGYYSLKRGNANTALVGISLNPLVGLPWFMYHGTYGYIYLYDGNSGIQDVGIFPVKRDDIAEASTIYLLGFSNSEPSTHGTGIEIYNADGKVVYSSEQQYLEAVACGSTDAEVTLQDNLVFFTLGVDHAADILTGHQTGSYGAEYTKYPALEVTSNKDEITNAELCA